MTTDFFKELQYFRKKQTIEQIHLEQKLKQFSDSLVFVAVESIYSMDGDAAPLQEVVKLSKLYKVFPLLHHLKQL